MSDFNSKLQEDIKSTSDLKRKNEEDTETVETSDKGTSKESKSKGDLDANLLLGLSEGEVSDLDFVLKSKSSLPPKKLHRAVEKKSDKFVYLQAPRANRSSRVGKDYQADLNFVAKGEEEDEQRDKVVGEISQ
jgi:hypothetical protein